MVQATIGFVNTLGIFEQKYWSPGNTSVTQNKLSSAEYQKYKAQVEEPDIFDELKFLLQISIDGLLAILRIFLSIFLIFPTLVSVFGVPAGLSALLQATVWLIYYLGWHQYRTQKSLTGYL